MKRQGSGWKGESRRHSLARKGIRTAPSRYGMAGGRIVTVEHEVFTWDELPEDAKQKAIEKYWDINIDHEWYDQDGLLDLTEEEMKAIGVTMSEKWWESDKPKNPLGNIIGEYPAHTGLIGYEIQEFDIDRDNYIQFKNIKIRDKEVFRKFLGIPKNLWDRIYVGFENPSSRGHDTRIIFTMKEYYDKTKKKDDEILSRASKRWDSKVDDAKASLRTSYNYLTSEEGISETLKANEYEFTRDGEIF